MKELDRLHAARRELTRERRILEAAERDLASQIATICDHRDARDMECDDDNGYGRWWKHKYKWCPDCHAENHYGIWLKRETSEE